MRNIRLLAHPSARRGRLSWRVVRNGAELFDDSEIGLEFKDRRQFEPFKVIHLIFGAQIQALAIRIASAMPAIQLNAGRVEQSAH